MEGLALDVTIREAAERDLQGVYDVERSSFKNPYSLSLLMALHRLRPRIFLVAESGRKLVGFIIATYYMGRGHIISIAVHPQDRGRGIGKKLVSESLKALQRLGVTIVRLEVRRSNTVAQRFYKDLGFKHSYTIEGYYGGEDGLVYYRSLREVAE